MSIRYTSKFKLDINAFNEVYLNKITCLAFQLQQVKDTCREHFLSHTRDAKKNTLLNVIRFYQKI